MIGRAVDGDDLVADFHSGALRRRAFQHAVDEVAPVDARREDADAGIGDPGAPEAVVSFFARQGRAAEDGEQDVVVDVVGRQQAGVGHLQLAEQRVDAARRLVEVRGRHDAGARLGCALRPVRRRPAAPCPRTTLPSSRRRHRTARPKSWLAAVAAGAACAASWARAGPCAASVSAMKTAASRAQRSDSPLRGRHRRWPTQGSAAYLWSPRTQPAEHGSGETISRRRKQSQLQLRKPGNDRVISRRSGRRRPALPIPS